jgi:hypothetical protein
MAIAVSLHDHHVSILTVDARARTLRIGTTFTEGRAVEHAEAVFMGLEAYVLDGDALGTIIDDIRLIDPLTLFLEHAATMQSTYNRHGAHAPWVESIQEAQRYFERHNVQGYCVDSSIGFQAAVWAKALDTRWIPAQPGPQT